MNKYIRFLTDPHFRFRLLSSHNLLFWMSDRKILERLYYLKSGKKLNLNDPQTFNEKIQWLKLYNRKPEYSNMVDKFEAKKIVADKIGGEHIIPTINVWNKFQEIDFDSLPDQFVLKCTHDSGGLVICRDKSQLDIKKAKKKINKSLKRNYYYASREWPYKNVKPRIIAEKFMTDEANSASLIDYKFYCFDGQPKFLYISKGLENHSTASISFVSLDWEFEPFRRNDFKPFDELPPKPKKFDEMIKIAKKLSAGMSFVRVDLYEINNQVYFSELTFSPCSGLMPFDKEEYDKIIGDMLTLPETGKKSF